MKKFNKISIITVLAIALVVGFTGQNVAHAVVVPGTSGFLGLADTYSVFGTTGIKLGAFSTVWGNVGENGAGDTTISTHQAGTYYSVSQSGTVGVDITAARTALDLATQTGVGILDLDIPNTIGPGVYDVGSTATFSAAQTLYGAGTYIFRGASSIAQTAGGTMTLTGGACASNVYWDAGSDMTFAAGGNIEGTIIAGTAITFAAPLTLKGRALAGSDVEMNSQAITITEPICTAPTLQGTLHVTKTVVNTGGGTKVPGDFTMNIHAFNSSQDTSFLGDAGGTSTTLDVGAYSVTETGPTGYTSSGNCSGTITDGITSDCTITNTYRRQSSGGSIARVVVPVFQPTITILSTPVVVPVIPMLPTTGFPPQESSTWYESLLNNILNLFR